MTTTTATAPCASWCIHHETYDAEEWTRCGTEQQVVTTIPLLRSRTGEVVRDPGSPITLGLFRNAMDEDDVHPTIVVVQQDGWALDLTAREALALARALLEAAETAAGWSA